jgi:hypothetical protein
MDYDNRGKYTQSMMAHNMRKKTKETGKVTEHDLGKTFVNCIFFQPISFTFFVDTVSKKEAVQKFLMSRTS